MYTKRILYPLSLLFFSHLIQLGLAKDHPIAVTCSSSVFTPNGTYDNNLRTLLSYLNFGTPLTGHGSASQGLGQDRVYGLAHCRRNITTTDCHACVKRARNEIQRLCPFNKQGVVYRTYCQLRYSDFDFLDQIDDQHCYSTVNATSASNPVYFDRQIIKFVSKLEKGVYDDPNMFALAALKIGESEMLYGLVHQCSGDPSSLDCKNCLVVGLSMDASYLIGKGENLFRRSCDVGFEVFPFVFSRENVSLLFSANKL